jgi:hypothetical protein
MKLFNRSKWRDVMVFQYLEHSFVMQARKTRIGAIKFRIARADGHFAATTRLTEKHLQDVGLWDKTGTHD